MLWIESLIFALDICLLVFTILQRIRLYYGNTTLNKLSLVPFDISIMALTVRAINVVYQIYYEAWIICYTDQCMKIGEDFIKDLSYPNLRNCFFYFLMWLNWTMYFVFVMSLAAEHRIYWNFILFQKKTPFNQLDQMKG